MSLLQTTDFCAVFGARGMAGSAISRALSRQGYTQQLLPSRQELDLLDRSAVDQWMQQQRPDLGALAAKTLVELPEPEGALATGVIKPMDEDFGGNGGVGEVILYPNASWERDIMSLDATNGLYHATVEVTEIVGDDDEKNEIKYKLRFLMFRPDLAELEMGAAQGAGLGGR